jgi:parallel beta-helix repeat protein
MSYTKRQWANNNIGAPYGPINATRLNGLETAVEELKTLTFNVKDYGAIGDGTTDDTVAIVATITAAASGDTILFPKGTFRVKTSGAFNSAVQLGSKSLRFLGSKSVIQADPASATGIRLISMVGTDQVIEGIEFDPNGVTSAICVFLSNASRTTIRQCLFTNPQNAGVWITGTTSDLSVIDNKFSGVNYGVLADAASTCTRVLIQGNRFMGGATGDAIEINTPTTGSSDIHIVGNIISGYTNTSSSGIGIGMATVSHGSIVGNLIYNCGLDGIHFEDGTNGITVTGNKIRSCGRAGISINSSNASRNTTDIVVTGNTVQDCATNAGSAGIAIEGVQAHRGHVVSGNLVRNCGRAAATVYGILVGGLTARDCSVTGNVVSNTVGSTTAGIVVSNGSTITISGNRCFDDQGGKTQIYGLQTIGSSDNNTITGNDFTANLTGEMSLVGTSNKVRPAKTATSLTYSTTIATDAAVSEAFTIVATNGTAFTISNPTNANKGMEIIYDIKNSSGGAMGAITWGAAFLLAGAFTNPASTKRRTISFYYDGTNWIETNRAAADI